MLSLRNRFGIPGVISVIALVFAMLGGAYAASNDGGGKATASAKGKPGPRGPRGKTGPAGPAGPQGPAGAKGDTGSAGANGKDGTNGKDGVSTETVTFAGVKGACTAGGIEVKSASPTVNVCNGKNGNAGAPGATGPTGPEGSPWTTGGLLPSGKTVSGAWNTTLSPLKLEVGPGNFAYKGYFNISYTLPLTAALPEANVLVLPEAYEGEDEVGSEHQNCPGKTTNPKAKAGFLCVYTQLKEYSSVFVAVNSFVSGASLQDIAFEAGGAKPGLAAYGTWAVTAP